MELFFPLIGVFAVAAAMVAATACILVPGPKHIVSRVFFGTIGFIFGGAVCTTITIVFVTMHSTPIAVVVFLVYGAICSFAVIKLLGAVRRAMGSGRSRLPRMSDLQPDKNIPVIRLDAAAWKIRDDVYDSLFAAVGAPPWHGRNFDALHDSVVTGSINSVEVPYRLVIQGLNIAAPDAQAFATELVGLFGEFESEGCPVSMEIVS